MPGFPPETTGVIPSGSPGALIVRDGQWEVWRSSTDYLLGGPATPYGNFDLKGLDQPPRRTRLVERGWDHGSYFEGDDRFEHRYVTWSGVCLGDDADEIATVRGAIARIFRPLEEGEGPIVLSWKGWGLPVRRLTGRTGRLEYNHDWQTRAGAIPMGWEFIAPDPRIYSAAEIDTGLINLNGGSSSVSQAVSNLGDMRTYPTIEVTGPALNPRVVNAQDSNKSIKIDTNLLAGETLVIDTVARTVFKAGVNVSGLIRLSDNQWWTLKPGVNNITLSRTGTVGVASLRLKYRHAYSTEGSP